MLKGLRVFYQVYKGTRSLPNFRRISVRTIAVSSADYSSPFEPQNVAVSNSENSLRSNNAKSTETNQSKKPRGKKSNTKLIKKISKLSRRDSKDETSKQNVLLRELQEAVNIYNQKFNIQIGFDSVQNDEDIIGKFVFTRERPYVVLNGVEIVYQASDGDGLAIVPKTLYQQHFAIDVSNQFAILKVPKTVVGDIVTVELLMHNFNYVETALVKVENAHSRRTRRKDNLIVCNKFGECSGCQFQMLSYNDQLELKQNVIQKAFDFFYPEIYNSMNKYEVGVVSPSPMEYSYRTKLTPHYTFKKSASKSELVNLKIGIKHVNPTKGNVDITNCPIASKSLNRELPQVRRDILRTLSSQDQKYPTATALLRESIRIDFNTGEFDVVCLTDPKKIVTEKVGDYVFQFPANEFFQNNNTILPSVIDFINFHLQDINYKNVIDTYCGSGFFGISLSKSIPEGGKVFGVEISKNSIEYATHNAKINGLRIPDTIQFIEGSADGIFANDSFKQSNIKGSESVVIMDPSRKGSNLGFLEQLIRFRPQAVVYVSCNVFTQARDIRTLMSLQTPDTKYRVKNITGFDFFPQTKHVESVAVLELM